MDCFPTIDACCGVRIEPDHKVDSESEYERDHKESQNLPRGRPSADDEVQTTIYPTTRRAQERVGSCLEIQIPVL